MRMKFIALLPVRDEGDIIRETLIHALGWADRVYVYDTGSVDDTYDVVRALAKEDDRIRVLGSEPVYFNENRVRGLLFETARGELKDGDWFLRIDADELHHVRPQDFVAARVHDNEGVVYHQYYDFQLTRSEVEKLDTEGAVAAERRIPISQRRRAYTVSYYAEPRMCRYRSSMRWPATVSFPYNAGLVARERLPIRHYPCRDPLQLARRCKLRAIMMKNHYNRANWTDPDAHHWSEEDWRSFVIDDQDPNLRFWTPGSDLPEVRQTNHLATRPVRLVQHALYATQLPRAFDLTRCRWSNEDCPVPISPEIQAALARELGT
jgi:glycosyltransferase involved in cell wall biosynthesis